MQRLDSLRPLLEQAEAAYEDYEAREAEAARLHAAAQARVDTLHVGQLTIITPFAQAETARELFSEVWAEHFGTVGHSPALEKVVFTFQWSDDLVPIHVVEPVRPVEGTSQRGREEVLARIRNVIAVTISADMGELGTKVGRWVAGNPLEPRPLDAVYRLIAVTESHASRTCLGGDVRSCATAMGLGKETGIERIEAWYTPAERQALVRRTTFMRSRLTDPSARRCVEGDELPACDRLLLEWDRDWTPFVGPQRETLVAYALEAGGQGSWDRLIEDPQMEPAAALEYASMMPLDDLVSGWLDRLMASRPDTYERLIPRSGLAILWSLFFGALAMRSTRWRLG